MLISDDVPNGFTPGMNDDSGAASALAFIVAGVLFLGVLGVLMVTILHQVPPATVAQSVNAGHLTESKQVLEHFVLNMEPLDSSTPGLALDVGQLDRSEVTRLFAGTNGGTYTYTSTSTSHGGKPSATLSVTPNYGDSGGGTTVTVSLKFALYARTGIPSITFDGLDCTGVSVATRHDATCRTPAHVAGKVSVSVVTQDNKGNDVTYTGDQVYEYVDGLGSTAPIYHTYAQIKVALAQYLSCTPGVTTCLADPGCGTASCNVADRDDFQVLLDGPTQDEACTFGPNPPPGIAIAPSVSTMIMDDGTGTGTTERVEARVLVFESLSTYDDSGAGLSTSGRLCLS